MDILREVSSSLMPTNEEYSKIKSILSLFKEKIRINSAVTELGGSASKDTWLRGNHDIDIYVKFSLEKYKNKGISSILGKELKKSFKTIKLHGSRDYYQVKIKPYTIEIIPIIDIKKVEDALNITDISPFHCKYVKKFSKNNEIRLSKSFCRSANCYGAESYISGFSGYVLEILTIHYGSFLNLVKNASKWKAKTCIGNKKIIEKLNMSKKLGPLILIDPVDPTRNAAAALSYEKYSRFIDSCKSFLKKPAKEFFIKKAFDKNDVKRKNVKNKVIFLKAEPLNGKKDVVGAKILKCFNYIKMKLSQNDFNILAADWNWDDDAVFYYVFNKKSLSKNTVHYGPPLNAEKHSKEFARKWKKHSIKKDNKRLYVVVKRKFVRPEECLKYLLKNDSNIKRYIRHISILE